MVSSSSVIRIGHISNTIHEHFVLLYRPLSHNCVTVLRKTSFIHWMLVYYYILWWLGYGSADGKIAVAFVHRQGSIFQNVTIRTWGPFVLLLSGYWELFLQEWSNQGLKVNKHTHPFYAEVLNTWSYTFNPPYAFMYRNGFTCECILTCYSKVVNPLAPEFSLKF